jgi:hypothetical protein
LPSNELKNVTVEKLDIAKDAIDRKYYKRQEDPAYFKSTKANRGPLKPGWQNNTKPMMCAYKLVTVNFNYWGLQTKVEQLLHEVNILV